MKTYIKIKGKVVEFEGNKPIRVLLNEEVIERRRKSSPEYKASQMSYSCLLDAFESAVIEAAQGNAHGLKYASVYRRELLKRGLNSQETNSSLVFDNIIV